MSKPKLEGAWAKINRAKYHLEQLQLELSRHPHGEGASFRDDLKARQHVFSYNAPRKRFIDYAVISGEIISQARTALEHAVREMSVGVRDTEHTGFPVIEVSTKYKDDGRPKVRRINKTARAVVKRLQPFNLQPFDKKGRDSLLWILHDMWNTDKHRLLHIVAADNEALLRPSKRIIHPSVNLLFEANAVSEAKP